jgi:hypothetical protein
METIQGILSILAGESFLNPSGVKLVMRNTPPGGSEKQRAAAATDFLTRVLGASSGNDVSASGDSQDPTVFLMDNATLV